MAAKVKTATIRNPEVIAMFREMIGDGKNPSSDISVTFDKYATMVEQVGRFHMINVILAKTCKAHIAYAEAVNKEALPYVAIPKPLITDEEACKSFNRRYNDCANGPLIKRIIAVGSHIAKFKIDIEKQDSAFLFDSAVPISPFDNTVDFRAIAQSNSRLAMSFISKLLGVVKKVYDLISTPDIPVGSFTTMALSAIDEMEKLVPRCQDAFRKIRNSVNLLETNFNQYYRSYKIGNQNPAVILESFVTDVMKSSSKNRPNPALVVQFRKILAFYQKQQSLSGHKGMLSEVNESFRELESQMLAQGYTDDSDQ